MGISGVVDREEIPLCCYCNKELDAFTSTGGNIIPPEPGDISICFYCRNVMEYTDDLGMVNITQEKLNSLDEVTLTTIQTLVQQKLDDLAKR